jgi:Contact-dependent growth inhibition CdiA C-terminal domain
VVESSSILEDSFSNLGQYIIWHAKIYGMINKRVGLIVIPPGVFVNVHEKLVVDFLATKFGYDVAFLVPDRRKGAKTPDIKMNDIFWEIKSPTGKSSRTIENNLRSALLQSPNIILDLRRIDGRIPTKKLLDEIEHRFNDARAIKRIIVITRQETAVDFKR